MNTKQDLQDEHEAGFSRFTRLARWGLWCSWTFS